MKKYFSVIFLVLVLLAIMLSSNESVKVMNNIFIMDFDQTEEESLTIIIDPGHGGRDPGKVGVNDALEKDINLEIAFKLKELLEENNFDVIMTREEDVGLYTSDDSNKKNADLNARVDMINNSGASLAISIHQNSFQEEYVKGAQVFYHAQSKTGKQLAEIMQAQIVETIADGNHRKAKSNDSYYMLKKTECPFIIIECGYLSNRGEAELLRNEEYQDKMALAIRLGLQKFIDEDGLDVTVQPSR